MAGAPCRPGHSNLSELLDAFRRRVAEPFSPLSLRCAPGTLGESERTLPWAVIGLVSGRLFGGSNVGDRSVKLREAASTIFALTAVLLALTYWRTRPGFARYAFATNTALMTGGFLLIGRQLTGYFLTT